MIQRKKIILSFENKEQAIVFIKKIHKRIKSEELMATLKNNKVEVRIFNLDEKKNIINILNKLKKEMNKDGNRSKSGKK